MIGFRHVNSFKEMVKAFSVHFTQFVNPRLSVGKLAPDFTLERNDDTGSVTLSEFRGERPVVLIFGSYT